MNYPYSDEFMYGADFGTDAVGAGVLGVFLAIYLVFLLFVLAFSVVSYILTSLGTYTIAERRGIRHPWLAWIPIGNVWILGSISDQYQYIVKGKIRNRRKVMLGLYIGIIAVYIVVLFAAITGAILSENAAYAGGETAMLLLIVLCMLGLFITSIILLVFYYTSLYDLYSSCHPSNASLYVVLSILFSVTMPFFVFLAARRIWVCLPESKRLCRCSRKSFPSRSLLRKKPLQHNRKKKWQKWKKALQSRKNLKNK